MICPKCGSPNAYVIDSRIVSRVQQRRRRMCADCKTRFTSVEIPLERMQELENKEKIFSKICCLCSKEVTDNG